MRPGLWPIGPRPPLGRPWTPSSTTTTWRGRQMLPTRLHSPILLVCWEQQDKNKFALFTYRVFKNITIKDIGQFFVICDVNNALRRLAFYPMSRKSDQLKIAEKKTEIRPWDFENCWIAMFYFLSSLFDEIWNVLEAFYWRKDEFNFQITLQLLLPIANSRRLTIVEPRMATPLCYGSEADSCLVAGGITHMNT